MMNNYFDEPDPNDDDDNVTMEPLDSLQSNEYINNSNNEDNLSTPINTYSFFDEPDSNSNNNNNNNNNHLSVHQESSASPPPPSATLSNVDNASAKLMK